MIAQYPLASRLLERFLPNESMTVVDAGARGGGELVRWGSLGKHLRLLNFEPDEAAQQAIQRMAKGYEGDIRNFSACLGRTGKARSLYLSKASQYNTSLLPINIDRYRRKGWVYQGKKVRVSDLYEIADVREVDCVSLDDFLSSQKIDDVDYVKVDIEGAELELLEASRETLDKAVGVSVDVLFHHDWVDAPVFADVDRFLRSNGFVLFDLRSVKRTQQFDAPFDLIDESGQLHGQIACGDAIYLRDFLETKSSAPPWPKLLKLAVAAEVNQHADFAFELVLFARDQTADATKKEMLTRVYNEASADYELWMRQFAGSRKLARLQAWARRSLPKSVLNRLRPLAWTVRRLVTSAGSK